MSGNRMKDMQKLETGWDNRLTIGPINLSLNQHQYGAVRSSAATSLLPNNVSRDDSRVSRAGFAYEIKPKPLTAYSSISTTLGFKHHSGTDESKELAVVRSILARESVLLKLLTLCNKIAKYDILVQSSMTLESELLDTLALMRSTTINFIESLCVWRDSATDQKSKHSRVFEWEDQNYTLKIISDLDFLADQPILLASLKLTKATMISNPLMLSNTLEDMDLHADPVKRASVDSGGLSNGDVFFERLRIRKAEKVILKEKSMYADSSSDAVNKNKYDDAKKCLPQIPAELTNDEQNEMAELISQLDVLTKRSKTYSSRTKCSDDELNIEAVPINRSLSASNRFSSALEFSSFGNDGDRSSPIVITADDLELLSRIPDPCPRLLLAGAATLIILRSARAAQDEDEVTSLSCFSCFESNAARISPFCLHLMLNLTIQSEQATLDIAYDNFLSLTYLSDETAYAMNNVDPAVLRKVSETQVTCWQDAYFRNLNSDRIQQLMTHDFKLNTI